MTRTDLFKQAHKITKEIIQKGDNYKSTFGIVLKDLYATAKANVLPKLKGTPKQVAWAEKIRAYLKAQSIQWLEQFNTPKYNTSKAIQRKIENTKKTIECIAKETSAVWYIDRSSYDCWMNDMHE